MTRSPGPARQTLGEPTRRRQAVHESCRPEPRREARATSPFHPRTSYKSVVQSEREPDACSSSARRDGSTCRHLTHRLARRVLNLAPPAGHHFTSVRRNLDPPYPTIADRRRRLTKLKREVNLTVRIGSRSNQRGGVGAVDIDRVLCALNRPGVAKYPHRRRIRAIQPYVSG